MMIYMNGLQSNGQYILWWHCFFFFYNHAFLRYILLTRRDKLVGYSDDNRKGEKILVDDGLLLSTWRWLIQRYKKSLPSWNMYDLALFLFLISPQGRETHIDRYIVAISKSCTLYNRSKHCLCKLSAALNPPALIDWHVLLHCFFIFKPGLSAREPPRSISTTI